MTHPLDWLLLRLAVRRLRRRRGDFYYDLASALEDRVPLYTILRKLEARARRRSRGDQLLYRRMLRAAMGGSLARALQGVMPPTELLMIDALQGGGDERLSQGLHFLSGTVDKVDGMFRAVRKAVAYPLLLLGAMTGILVAFSLHAVPVLADLIDPARWPPLGRALYAVAWTIRHHGLTLGAAVLAAGGLFVWSLPRWQGRLRRRLDRHPPFSLYRDFSGAMLVISLSSLMRAGVSLRASLERAGRFSAPWMRWHLRQILSRLSGRESAQFGRAFATGVLNPTMEDRVQDAAERRDPVAAFVRIGIGSIDRLQLGISDSAARLNGLLMVAAAMLLLFLLGGFLATVMEAQSSLQSEMGGL
jgi:type II secretory pathway component PulF